IGGTLRDTSDHMRWKVDVAGAYSRRDYLDDRTAEFEDGATYEFRERRSYGGSTLFTAALANDGMGDLGAFATPSIRLGVIYEHTDTYDQGERLRGGPNRIGAELSVLDMIYLRYGHAEGDEVEGSSFGFGFSLKYRNMMGVKMDFANAPKVAFFVNGDDHYNRWGLTFFVDPYRLLKKG